MGVRTVQSFDSLRASANRDSFSPSIAPQPMKIFDFRHAGLGYVIHCGPLWSRTASCQCFEGFPQGGPGRWSAPCV